MLLYTPKACSYFSAFEYLETREFKSSFWWIALLWQSTLVLEISKKSNGRHSKTIGNSRIFNLLVRYPRLCKVRWPVRSVELDIVQKCRFQEILFKPKHELKMFNRNRKEKFRLLLLRSWFDYLHILRIANRRSVQF